MQGSEFGYGSGWSLETPNAATSTNYYLQSQQYSTQSQQIQAHQDTYSPQGISNSNPLPADTFYDPTGAAENDSSDMFLSSDTQNQTIFQSYAQDSQTNASAGSTWANVFDPSVREPDSSQPVDKLNTSHAQGQSAHITSDSGSSLVHQHPHVNGTPAPNGNIQSRNLQGQPQLRADMIENAGSWIGRAPTSKVYSFTAQPQPGIKSDPWNHASTPNMNPVFYYEQPPSHISKDFNLVARAVWKYLRDMCDQVCTFADFIRTSQIVRLFVEYASPTLHISLAIFDSHLFADPPDAYRSLDELARFPTPFPHTKGGS